MTDESNKRHPETRHGVDYMQIECPFCVAYYNQPCRNPKTRVVRPKGVYCGVRVVQVNRIEDERAERQARDLENARQQASKNERAAAFLTDYEQVVRRHGLAFSHEDGQGGFIVTDTNLVRLLAWVFCATPKITAPESDLAKLDAAAAVIEKDTSDEAAAKDRIIEGLRADFREVVNAHMNIVRFGSISEVLNSASDFQKACGEFMQKNLLALGDLLEVPTEE